MVGCGATRRQRSLRLRFTSSTPLSIVNPGLRLLGARSGSCGGSRNSPFRPTELASGTRANFAPSLSPFRGSVAVARAHAAPSSPLLSWSRNLMRCNAKFCQ